MRAKSTFLLILPLCLLLAGCEHGAAGVTTSRATDRVPEGRMAPESELVDTARSVVEALAGADYARLARYVHPERGVRLSSYAFVRANEDRVLTADQVRDAVRDSQLHIWGHHDGTGEPITMTTRAYFERYVYDANYLAAAQVSVDRRSGRGNTIDNVAEVYPDGRVVEFHLPGTERYAGMDWRSLRLVFVERGASWRLVGIVHDEWTI